MPGLLVRYMFSELVRVTALATAVVVVVIAFGAAIKPLAGDDLLSPLQTLKYIILAIVPMMQFALPFAAAFAATIVLHRMTSENEILVMAASGLSYRRVLQPLFALGVALALAMVVLTQWVIPKFWGMMEQTLSRDVTRVFQASIDSGRPFQLGDLQIHADQLRVITNPSDVNADTRLFLSRVAAAEMSPQGRIVTDVTASRGVVDIYRDQYATYLKLRLLDTVAFNGRTGELGWGPEISPDRAIVIPNPSKNEPRAMTQQALLRMRDQPTMYGSVRNARQAIIDRLREHNMFKALHDRIEQDNTVQLQQYGTQQRVCTITAESMSGNQFVSDDAPVEVTHYENDRPVRRLQCRRATLQRSAGASVGDGSFDLVLDDVQVTDLRSNGSTNSRAQLVLPGLSLDALANDDIHTWSSQELINRARDRHPRLTERLQSEIDEIRDEIVGRLNKRYALSLTALLLPVVGGTLAVLLRNSQPLTVYLIAFMPAILDLIVISGGEQTVRQGYVVEGLTLLWSGNALLALIFLGVFIRLARN